MSPLPGVAGTISISKEMASSAISELSIITGRVVAVMDDFSDPSMVILVDKIDAPDLLMSIVVTEPIPAVSQKAPACTIEQLCGILRSPPTYVP